VRVRLILGWWMGTPLSLYKGHRFPVEIISDCVWLIRKSSRGRAALLPGGASAEPGKGESPW
jgi:hypothetical protein